MEYRSPDWSRVRCMFEAPILDDHKWAKTPDIPADAFIIDLEDSVPLAAKDEARVRAVSFIEDASFFGDRLSVPRANHLDTPWGHDDVVAFAKAGAQIIMIPKVDTPGDVHAVLDLARAHGADPKILVSIESARGVIECGDIFAVPEVVAATFGSGDLHVDAGYPLREPDGSLNRALLYAKSKTALAGAAYGVAVLGMAYQTNVRDEDEVRETVAAERLLGFSGLAAFYPPHVPIINAACTPSAAEVASATEVITTYEQAVAEGNPAVQLPNGAVILVHQYKAAQDLLARQRP
jgi:citrate lyase beta subunit